MKAYGLLVHARFKGLFSLIKNIVNLCTEQISQLMNSELVNVSETPKYTRVQINSYNCVIISGLNVEESALPLVVLIFAKNVGKQIDSRPCLSYVSH